MKYDVLTFDTQTVEHQSFDFDGRWLAQLKQFKDGPTKVVLSTVVIFEIRKHLAAKLLQAKDAFEVAAKKAAFYGLKSAHDPAFEPIEGDMRALADARLRAFLTGIGAQPISPDAISVSELMRQYFVPALPFTAAGKKKSEFPDAVSLMSLEAWAKKEHKTILAVSGDGDWSAFAEKSKHIDVVTTLLEAFDLLQEHAEEATKIIEGLLAMIASEPESDVLSEFRTQLEAEVSSATVTAYAESHMQVETEQVDLSLRGFVLSGQPPEFDFKVVQAGPSILVASVELALSVTASATFAFSVWDSVDKEEISMGSADVERYVDLEATLLVTFKPDLIEGWAVDTVELVEVENPDFGYVEMDYGDDDFEIG